MIWTELSVYTTDQSIEIISNFIHEAGAEGTCIESLVCIHQPQKNGDQQYKEGISIIKGYFSESVSIHAVQEQLVQRIEALKDLDMYPTYIKYEQKSVHEDDWSNNWKPYYKASRISNLLVVAPTWSKDVSAYHQQHKILLDPGMTFGTGTHPTTVLCLRALEQCIRGGEEVIDVGTGSGVLAIAAVRLGAKHVLALDLNPIAVTTAMDNSVRNDVHTQVTAHQSDLLNITRQNVQPLGVSIPVQIVVANMLAETILLFLDDVYRVLQPSGLYIISGIWENKRDVIDEALRKACFHVQFVHCEQNWYAFIAQKQ